MKKNLVLFILLIVSCSKKDIDNEVVLTKNLAIPPYDTVAVDSFSNGAVSVDVARQIRISSIQYQDSLKEAVKKMEAEKLLKKETEEKDKAAKTLETEKKKTEETKIKNDKKKPETEITPSQNTTHQ